MISARDYNDAVEMAVKEAFNEITPDDINPTDINEYKDEIRENIIENIADWVYFIENDDTIDHADDETKEEYMDKAAEMVESGMVIDSDNMNIDIPEKLVAGNVEYDDPLISDIRGEGRTEWEEGEITDDDFYEEYDNKDVLENLDYKEIGDGLYISKEDYENNIKEYEEDKVDIDEDNTENDNKDNVENNDDDYEPVCA